MKAWIYFARFGSDGPIKIGRACDPDSRVKGLMIGSPIAIFLLGAVLSNRAEEEELEIHERLCAYCVRGEWFEAEAALREMKTLDDRWVAADKLRAVRSNRPSSQNKRRTYVGTRVTHAEEAWLRVEMKKRDMSMSDLIRFALENYLSPLTRSEM